MEVAEGLCKALCFSPWTPATHYVHYAPLRIAVYAFIYMYHVSFQVLILYVMLLA
ncbi:hypothetical protein FKM82_000847 [Ascaphus truei]